MFEDIIDTEKKLTPEDKTSGMSCETCSWASFILSNYRDNILCERDHQHKKKKYFCFSWQIRKKVLDN